MCLKHPPSTRATRQTRAHGSTLWLCIATNGRRHACCPVVREQADSCRQSTAGTQCERSTPRHPDRNLINPRSAWYTGYTMGRCLTAHDDFAKTNSSTCIHQTETILTANLVVRTRQIQLSTCTIQKDLHQSCNPICAAQCTYKCNTHLRAC